ncbi:MAG: M16 family metallopeptidase, partial [bacterium]
MKSLFYSLLLVLVVNASFSQSTLGDKILIDPSVIKGTLQNGLTYYIKENKKPEKKVELRLVVKVGSIMEDDDQQGLAHMAEHMAFNGTKNFKKNDIVSFLQGIGVEFGGDLNAYTGFDETVYILPIPTDQPSNIEKGFQILEDWAHQVTYLDEDIDSERAIILEESRLGKSGEERMFKKIYPELFKGSKYANRLPIGKDSIIKYFKHDAIRRFYRDWYRPDLMAVVVVGDISAKDAMEYINKYFSRLTSPSSPRPRVYAEVPAYQENKAMVVTDKESTGNEFAINYSAQKVRPTGTVGDFKKGLLRQLYISMMNGRLREITQKENPPFLYAGIGFESYAKFHEAFNIYGSTGTNDVKKGIDAALTEIERVKKFGFTGAELDRAKKNILSMYERQWNNRDKTESAVFADEYIRNFVSEETVPGIDAEFSYVKKLLPELGLDEVNAVTNLFKNEKNRFSFVMAPDKDADLKLPKSEEIIAMLDNKQNDNSIKPYEEKQISTELMTKVPNAGKVITKKVDTLLGTTELVLSNGVKVTLKATTFKNDQVLLSAYRYGGLTNYSLDDKYSAENAATLISSMGVGNFNPTDLRKAMAGKVATLTPNISNYTSGFSG